MLTPQELDELIELDGLQRPQTDQENDRALELYARLSYEQDTQYRQTLGNQAYGSFGDKDI